MRTLYLECNMGASGDMIASALYDLVDDKNSFLEKLKLVKIPETDIEFEIVKTSGISAFKTNVLIKGNQEAEHSPTQHKHTSKFDIENIINSLDIPLKIKDNAKRVYNIIADAEGKVHNADIKDIHFHEVGTLDAIADVVLCSMLFEEIGVDEVLASPINVGKGFVNCSHGVLPVPASATAEILKGVPVYSDDTYSELCTPTGAAVLKCFVNSYEDMPVMKICKIGYGAGSKKFEKANVVRAFLGERSNTSDKTADEVIELSCNIDDMTPEDLSFACELLLSRGALDVTQTPVYMKKSRLGVRLDVLCNKDKKNEMISLILRNTTTIGVREYKVKRYTLERNITHIDTRYGKIKIKCSKGYGIMKSKLEYEDVKAVALKEKTSPMNVRNEINADILGIKL